MKKNLLVLCFCLIAGGIFSQTAKDAIYSGLRPADAKPAVFSSQAEMDAKKESKKNAIKDLITQNSTDPVKVKMYREELWRFENAVVAEPKK
jgi:hypothetical protein